MTTQCDVLVVGAGIAGVCAAIEAAEALGECGRVVLASGGPLFSGSSFFEGTWGLGLIAPDGSEDEDDLARTIIEVGCDMADEELVRSFVSGIEPSVQRLQSWGVALKEPSKDAADQQEYIPCFDHKHRRWRGIEREPFAKAASARIAQLGVEVLERCELLDILQSDSGQVRGAVFFDADMGEFVQIGCKSLVLATGGTGSLFTRRLTKGDCSASAQALAVRAGCKLTNMEFIQFMPGLVSPVSGIVFNEKTFKCMELPTDVVGQLGGKDEARRLLELRSGHGPFTTRLDSRAIDMEIAKAGTEGLPIRPAMGDELPEFVRTYSAWLESSFGVAPGDEIRIAMYAHASNGGIAIDANARTGVPGLFAAGECTGGMHGADRLGGLSSANGLVFGMRAGRSAAAFAEQVPNDFDLPAFPRWTCVGSESWREVEAMLKQTMDTSCSIARAGDSLEDAGYELQSLSAKLTAQVQVCDANLAAMTRKTRLRIETANAIVQAAFAREASLGSHCRVDAT